MACPASQALEAKGSADSATHTCPQLTAVCLAATGSATSSGCCACTCWPYAQHLPTGGGRHGALSWPAVQGRRRLVHSKLG